MILQRDLHQPINCLRSWLYPASASYIWVLSFITVNTIAMKHKMGTSDRIIRAILAAAFITLYMTGAITGVIGIVLLVICIAVSITTLNYNYPRWAFEKVFHKQQRMRV